MRTTAQPGTEHLVFPTTGMLFLMWQAVTQALQPMQCEVDGHAPAVSDTVHSMLTPHVELAAALVEGVDRPSLLMSSTFNPITRFQLAWLPGI